MNQKIKLSTALLVLVIACKPQDLVDPETGRTSNWSEYSHSNTTEPDYAVVFPNDQVNTLIIDIGEDGWSDIRADMITLSGGEFGAGGNTPGGGGFGGVNPGGGGFGGPPNEGGAINIFNRDPEYVAATITFNENIWNNVGFRLKGNSSLSRAWSEGNYKLPFRLNFDKYEDEYPEIDNQRFYGFEELSMSPGYSDQSLMRDKLAADIFRDAGIPAARAAFYKVYIDFGEGQKYCGVYTMLEVIDDTMVDEQYGKTEGNIYKPESSLQSFSQSLFEKKNNVDKADYSDVQSFVTALNSSNRSTNTDTWRNEIESTFDVNHFLKYLAINNTIVNWDSYGGMAHNYYLYNHGGLLKWIPWDHNEAFTSSAGRSSAVSLAMTEVSETWPLIRYLADDPEYFKQYKNHLQTFVNDVFTPTGINSRIDDNYDLIQEFVTGSEPEQTGYSYLNGSADFESAINSLKNHIQTRYDEVQNFLK
ncbi:CotH kinase family protein [Jiulongibacter sediminis]|uniref:CotH kinase family protein n=1 Tax=Jiulongibacter sediminis TaxID=1605367 RepID=UPI0026EF077F|nr:CotH kinase family protein [Jiulongibacter sediminis]